MARVIADIFPCDVMRDDGSAESMCRAVVIVEPSAVLIYKQNGASVNKSFIPYDDFGRPLSTGEPYWISATGDEGPYKLRFFQKGGCGCGSPLRRIPLAKDLAGLSEE